jgi:hypothetical protein
MPGSGNVLKPKDVVEMPITLLGIEQKKELLWISYQPVPQELFPPCIRNMISKPPSEIGSNRRAAVLASFLGQVGWDREDAKCLWKEALEGSGISEEIFNKWFQGMHCPLCSTIKKESKGYPELGLAGLGYCQAEQRCKEFDSPVEYASDLRTDEDWNKGAFKTIMISNYARIFNWFSGRESSIELSEKECADLEAIVAELSIHRDKVLVYTRIRSKGRLRPKFLLKGIEEPNRFLLSEII